MRIKDSLKDNSKTIGIYDTSLYDPFCRVQDIANILQKHFPSKEHFSVAIPLSRQQKGYDLVLVNGNTGKSLTIQVKSSRVYYDSTIEDYYYFSLFNSFDAKNNYSDFYFFYITYPLLDKNSSPRGNWGKKILVFNKNQMVKLLRNLKTKKGKKERRFFEFCFNATDNEMWGWRGHYNKLYTKHLLENQSVHLKNKLK